MASKAITIPTDGLHETLCHIEPLSAVPPSTVAEIISLLRRQNISIPVKPSDELNNSNYAITDSSLSIRNRNNINPIILRKKSATKAEYFFS